MKYYLQIFIRSSILFGLVMGCLVGMQEGLAAGLRAGLLQGLFFGLFLSLILGTTLRILFKHLSRKYGNNVGYTQTLILNCQVSTAFQLGLKALQSLGAKIDRQDVSQLEIRAKTAMSWKSWGEIVELRFHKISDNSVEVEVSSRPKVSSTLIDYGKGQENLNSIVQILKS